MAFTAFSKSSKACEPFLSPPDALFTLIPSLQSPKIPPT
jgi:hypothetical protein